MCSERQKKVARLVQKELGEIFRKEAINIYPGKMISVTTARISPDLSFVKAYLSVFPSAESEEVLNRISKIAPNLRFALGKKVGKQLRIVPELSFYLDDSLDYIDNIDNLLK
jgi:ribosome-binding factor A